MIGVILFYVCFFFSRRFSLALLSLCLSLSGRRVRRLMTTTTMTLNTYDGVLS